MATKGVDRKAVTEALKKAAAFYFFRCGFAVTFEMGIMPWGSRRADLVANKVSGKIVICEVKSSLADYRSDNKWRSYLDFCDMFAFVMTPDLYAKLKDELPKKVGVLCLSPSTGYAYMAKRCTLLGLSDANRISTLARLSYRSGELSKRTQRARTKVFIGVPNDVDVVFTAKSRPPRKRRSKRSGFKKLNRIRRRQNGTA